MSNIYGGIEGDAEAEGVSNQNPSSIQSSSSSGGVNIRTVVGGVEMAPSLLVASSIATMPPMEEEGRVATEQQFIDSAEEIQEHFQSMHLNQVQPYSYPQFPHYAHIPHHIHTGHVQLTSDRVETGEQLPQHLEAYGPLSLAHGPIIGGEETSEEFLIHERMGGDLNRRVGHDDVDEQDECDDVGPIKLFVGQIPKNLSEEDIFPTFVEYGPIKDLMIIRDKLTSQHRGCAFVTFWSSISATKAQEELHDKYHFPGARKAVQIKPASSSTEQTLAEQENKLFIGMTSRNAEEDHLRELFTPFGEIREIYIIRNADGTNKGCAFLKFTQREFALAAIEALHEKYQMEGATRPLIVKFADSRGPRRHTQKVHVGGQQRRHSNPFYMPSAPPVPVYPSFQNPQVPPNMGIQQQAAQYPQSHFSQPPPHPGYMYQPPSYGHAPYSYHHPAGPFASVQTSASTSASAPSDIYELSRPGQQQRKNHPARQPRSSRSPKPTGFRQRQDISTNVNPRPREGPPGANLFIYHLPHDLTDADLATAFNPFGNVISAKVYVDKFTGESKGFGFVSYDAVLSAEQAIEQMNGFQIGSKRLKVQHKRINKPLGQQATSSGDDNRPSSASGQIYDLPTPPDQMHSVMRGIPQSGPPQQFHPSMASSHLDVELAATGPNLEGLEVGYKGDDAEEE